MKGVVFILCLNCVCFARSNDDVMGRVIAMEARMANNGKNDTDTNFI